MYRGVDSPTDVLAFALIQDSTDTTVFVTPPDEPPHLGEVLISYPTAAKQAEEHGHSVDRELAILVIHGVLHLFGYDHGTDEQEREMRGLEEAVLSTIETNAKKSRIPEEPKGRLEG
jgi:probable rRNA maturation factor